MRYFYFEASTPYVNTTQSTYWEFPDNFTDEAIYLFANAFKDDVAESYEYMALDDYEEFSDEERETIFEEYYDDCEVFFKEITREEYERQKLNEE